MANLKLNVKGQLNNLIPSIGNTYKFIIRYYDLSNNLLTDPRLTQNAEDIVTLTGNTFNLNFPLEDGNYSISDVKVRVYNNTILQGCFAEYILSSLTVNCGDTGECDPAITLTGTPTQSCVSTSVTVNGTSLVTTGGTAPYQYAFIKTSDFTDVGSLSWGTTKTWTADATTSYRIYTRGTSVSTETTCYDYIELTTIDCTAPPTECSPTVTISGTPTQTCLDEDTTTINGSGLSGNGGNGSYLWAIVKESDFTSVGALTFSGTKVWNVDHNTTYRIYVRDTSGIDHSTCYAYITVLAQDCTSETPSGDLEITLYYNE